MLKFFIFIILFTSSIVYSKTHGAKSMEFTFDDDVYKINVLENKDFEILFKKSAARYHLLKSNKKHEQILKELQSALDNNEKISITIDPNNQNILKVHKKKQ